MKYKTIAVSAIPTPFQIKSGEVWDALPDDAALEAARRLVRLKLVESAGTHTRVDLKELAPAIVPALVAEIKAAGWNCEIVSDQKEGGRLSITPPKTSGI